VPETTPSGAPARVLGAFDAGCVVVGAIVGVGIFFTPSRMAGLVQSDGRLLLTWAIAGVIALCGAMTFAELGGRYHASGAQYEILRDAYRPLPAFVFVFCNATAIQGGAIGIIAIVCVRNLGAAAGTGELGGPATLSLATVAIVGLAVANAVGVRWGARVQNVTVVCKVATLVALAALAALLPGRPDVPPPAGTVAPGWTAVLPALVPALFAFGGWQHALWISGEVKAPARTIPRALVFGVLLVVVVYVLATWAYLALLGGWQAVAASRALAADAAEVAIPGVGRRLLGAAVGVSALGVLNAQLLSGPRLVFGMARDGRFFPPFGRLHATLGTPVAAVVLLGAMALVLMWAAGFEGLDRLLTGVVFIDGVFFALTGLALIVLRRRDPAAFSAFRTPLFPLLPAVFVLGELGVVVGAHLDPAVLPATRIGLVWIAVAAAVYLALFRKGTGRR
jgi:APA family basic amino acid/polyamine antiporter